MKPQLRLVAIALTAIVAAGVGPAATAARADNANPGLIQQIQDTVSSTNLLDLPNTLLNGPQSPNGPDGGGTPGPVTPGDGTGTTSPNKVVDGAPESGGATVKPAVEGLIVRKNRPPAKLADVIDGFVVEVRWRELQPVRGEPIVHPNPIDDAIAEIRAKGTPMQIKVRLYAGVASPAWVKRIAGTVSLAHEDRSGTIPRFWDPAYGDAYDELHAELAALYDDVPEIREITVSRCTTFYAEPMVRHRSDRDIVNGLLAAGYSVAADRTCQLEQLEAHRVWERTRSGIALNPYQVLHPDGSTGIDLAFTEDVMAECRRLLGERCVLSNNSIRMPAFGGWMQDMYCSMAAAGGERSFQTANEWRVGDLEATIEWAIDHGAGAIELPGGFTDMLNRDQMVDLDQRLERATIRAASPSSC